MQYVSIRVSTLRGDQKIDFDAYLRIGQKHILYLRRGESLSGPQLSRLKTKSLQKMYISDQDEDNYRIYLSRNMDMAYDPSSKIPLEDRAIIIQGIQQANVEDVMENPAHAELYHAAKDGAARFMEFLNSQDLAAYHILNIENMDANIAHHGVAVSTLAVALAKRLGLKDEKQIQLLTLGAMLHDIGHVASGLFINRPVHKFPPEELTVYKNHPAIGSTKVKPLTHFDPSVVNIINQHEEYIDGKGFPGGLTESKMDPLSILVAPCNALDRLISFEKVKKSDAAKKLLLSGAGCYPLHHIQLLGDIMKSMKLT